MVQAKNIPHSRETEIWRAFSEALRPPPPMEPDEFAEKHRRLHPVYCSERPGPWSNDTFPYQRHVMNAIASAIRKGKRGFAFMKGGQIGGTDCAINGTLWLKRYYPGPQLFMTSTEQVASEFGRERFGPIIRDMEPLRRKYIPAARGDILTKRFIDGKLQLCGGQSVFKLQSTPYRIVVIDEMDSLAENLGNQGDPLKLAEVRTDSFSGPTLIIAYAHPSTKDRGVGRIYYELSDQCRCFVTHDCGEQFYFQWDHVKATPNREGMTQEQADYDPDCYAYYCPGCGAEVSDAERVAMMRNIELKSMLPPEIADKKTWSSAHASQLYSPQKTIRSFAIRWIECDCGKDENGTKVFYNKILGEPYESKIKSTSISEWRSRIVIPVRETDPDAYTRGQVPPGVRFLTAGQDTRAEEFHYVVWGYGLAHTVERSTVLRRWLIDWGEIKREEKSNVVESGELKVFDQLIYNRLFPTTYSDHVFDVRECAHDTGWNPIAIYEYCKSWPWRAVPTKGGADSSLSAAPPWRETNRPRYKLNDEEFELDQPLIVFNTYHLKTQLYGSLQREFEVFEYANGRDKEPTGKKKTKLVTLPTDVDDEFLAQSAAEFLTAGERKGERVWKARGDNHYADGNVYSYGLALKINPFQGGLSFDEAERLAEEEEERQRLREKQKQQKTPERPWIAERGGDWIRER